MKKKDKGLDDRKLIEKYEKGEQNVDAPLKKLLDRKTKDSVKKKKAKQ